MRLQFTLLCLIVYGTSCSAIRLKELSDNNNREEITSNNVSELNGTFENKCITNPETEGFSLWENLFVNTKHIDNWQDCKVILKISNNNHVTATLLLQDKIVESKTIYFKVKKGFINLRRQIVKAFIAGPLLWAIGDSKIVLSLTSTNNLFLARSSNGSTMILIAPAFASGGQMDCAFKRIE